MRISALQLFQKFLERPTFLVHPPLRQGLPLLAANLEELVASALESRPIVLLCISVRRRLTKARLAEGDPRTNAAPEVRRILHVAVVASVLVVWAAQVLGLGLHALLEHNPGGVIFACL